MNNCGLICRYLRTTSSIQSYLLFHFQTSRDPLPPEDFAEIFEEVKDMGVLIGKGGVYGQVT